MNSNNLKDIEELLKIIGCNIKQDESKKNGQTKCKVTIDPTGGSDTNCCANQDLDIPNGFQDVDPKVFVVLGEVVGNVLSGGLPLNTANSISNWFNLMGQIMETYASQQQYFQSGPGRLYDKKYKNISNPFCTCNCTTVDENDNSQSEKSNSNSDIIDIKNQMDKIYSHFESEISILKNELELLKKERKY